MNRIALRRRTLDERRMDSGSRFVELTVIGMDERFLR
jgi:hypothetical protein